MAPTPPFPHSSSAVSLPFFICFSMRGGTPSGSTQAAPPPSFSLLFWPCATTHATSSFLSPFLQFSLSLVPFAPEVPFLDVPQVGRLFLNFVLLCRPFLAALYARFLGQLPGFFHFFRPNFFSCFPLCCVPLFFLF